MHFCNTTTVQWLKHRALTHTNCSPLEMEESTYSWPWNHTQSKSFLTWNIQTILLRYCAYIGATLKNQNKSASTASLQGRKNDYLLEKLYEQMWRPIHYKFNTIIMSFSTIWKFSRVIFGRRWDKMANSSNPRFWNLWGIGT